jgi:hypothetical protein
MAVMLGTTALPAAMIAIAVGVVSCSSDSKPPLCDSVDDLRSSIQQTTNVQVGDNGLAELKANLGTVRADLDRVTADAKTEYSAEVGDVRTSVQALGAAVDTVAASRSAADISTTVAAAKQVRTNVGSLSDAVKSSC